jgi:hypothetical protein
LASTPVELVTSSAPIRTKFPVTWAGQRDEGRRVNEAGDESEGGCGGGIVTKGLRAHALSSV